MASVIGLNNVVIAKVKLLYVFEIWYLTLMLQFLTLPLYFTHLQAI